MLNVVFGVNAKVVTLKDRIDIDPVFLIMRLLSTTQTDFIKVLQVTDSTLADCKANEIDFELTTEALEDLAAGKVFLIEGNYNYEIFQAAASGDLDPTGKTLLERGLMRFDVATITDKKLDEPISEKTLID